MDELSEAARKLVDAAMEHDEPPPVDESWGTIVSRLTAEAPREVPDATPSQREPETQRTSSSWIVLAATVLLLGAGAWWWWNRPEPVVASPEPSDPQTVAAAPSDPATPRARTPPSSSSVEHLVADAEAALAAGDPDRAMALLERHAELAAIHPHAERRMALRILVLCAQGKQDAARDEARAFLGGHPDSQWAAEVRSSCAGH